MAKKSKPQDVADATIEGIDGAEATTAPASEPSEPADGTPMNVAPVVAEVIPEITTENKVPLHLLNRAAEAQRSVSDEARSKAHKDAIDAIDRAFGKAGKPVGAK